MPTRRDYLSQVLDGQGLSVAVQERDIPGPTVCIPAGLHSSEYCALETAQRLWLFDPILLRGRLIVLSLVNIAAFAARATYINPRDGLNLNRVLPDSAGGSSSHKIAEWLTHGTTALGLVAVFAMAVPQDAPRSGRMPEWGLQKNLTFTAYVSEFAKFQIPSAGRAMT